MSGSCQLADVPLAGFAVAVAADRRRHDLGDVLENQGAKALGIQAVRPLANPDPAAVVAATTACLSVPVDEFVVSSAFGLRAWLRVAHAARLGQAATDILSRARLLAGNSRAADGLRELGFTRIWSTAEQTTEDIFRYLVAQPLAGRRVVVLLDHESQRDSCHDLACRGADVVVIATSQPKPPPHMDTLRRLTEAIIRRAVDGVAFTSAAATENFLAQAKIDEVLDDTLDALATDVRPFCIGALAATPLRDHGLAPTVPAMPAVRELASAIHADLLSRRHTVAAGGQALEIRSEAVVVGGQLIPIQYGPLAVLRALVQRPGEVLAAADIRAVVPGWSDVDDHAIEMAISRLRRTLGNPALHGAQPLQTVMRRGYVWVG